MLITSVGVQTSEVRNDILRLLLTAFNNGTFVDTIHEIVSTTYLGPMINTTDEMGTSNAKTEQKDSGVLFFALSLAIIAVSLILIPIAVRICVRKALFDRKPS